MTHRNTAANQRVPGRNQASAALGDPFAVLAQGNFPARADLERLGRLREAALRGARQARTCWAADALSVTLTPDAAAGTLTHQGQRHRHERGRSHRQSRHHRALRHQEIPRDVERRFRQGRAADRPVRRRLLFGVHRRRQGHRAHQAQRFAGGALGIGRRRPVPDSEPPTRPTAAPKSSCTCATRTRNSSSRRACANWCASTRII